MKVLVTGANGFLGSATVAVLLGGEHEVRAMIRPGADLGTLKDDRVEVVRADLAQETDLSGVFDGIDCLIHIAAATRGDMATQLAATVEGTRRLLTAMIGSDCKRIVFASSFAVYDYAKIGRELTEESPQIDDRDESLGAYAVSKARQEKLARGMAAEYGWDLRVLRPGYIWGHGRQWHGAIGMVKKGMILVFAPSRVVPITHVFNSADAFRFLAYSEVATNGTYNLVDGHDVTAWRFARDYRAREGGVVVPVPYGVGMLAARAGLMEPGRYRMRFKPVRCVAQRLHSVGWKPLFTYERCLQLTYGRRVDG